MPTYEYVCKNCGHGVEVVQSMTDEPLTICDECGGELRKVFAPPAISFKGSGFYATDHRTKSKTSAEKGAERPEKGAERPEKGAERPEKGAEKKQPTEASKPSDPRGAPSSREATST